MSENLDLVRSIFAAWGRGDFSSVEWAYPEIDLANVRATGAWLIHVRNGKVTKFVPYWDRDRALADLGLGA